MIRKKKEGKRNEKKGKKKKMCVVCTSEVRRMKAQGIKANAMSVKM